MNEQIEKLVSTRRRFLVEAAVFGAVTAGGLAGCSTSPTTHPQLSIASRRNNE